MNDIAIVFSQIITYGIQADWVVPALVALRLILKKCPRYIICALWALVAVRLIFPFDIQSIFSLVPETSDITRPVDYYTTEAVRQVFPEIDSTPLMTVSGIQSNSTSATGDTLSAHLFYVGMIVWMIGVGILLVYALISYLRLRRMTHERITLEKGVYLCDRIPSPFILGIIRPKIFLPSNISEHDKPYVLAHERAHIKRRDHLWKPLGFLLLSVYWFNPLLWVAYILLCKDIEMACDEKVLKELGYESKKPYAIALINSAAPHRLISACPLAFGETSVKSRIKNVLNYKKPAFWIIIAAVALSIVIAVCFLTNPIEKLEETTAYPTDTSVDISGVYEEDDLDTLTISTDLPTIIYADNRYVYFDGDCGVVVYDMENEKPVFRMPLSQLQHLGFAIPYSIASDDGRYIIIKNRYDDSSNINTSLILSVATGEIVALNADEEVKKYKIFEIGHEGYDIKYDENGKNISERRYISGNKRYKLVVPGWRIKNTELTVTDLKSNTEKTYHIF